MKKISLSVDMSGFAYDSENPTRETERLCYRLNRILESMAEGGLEIRMSESQDFQDSENYLRTLFSQIFSPPEDITQFNSPSNLDILMSPEIAGMIGRERADFLLEGIRPLVTGGDSETLKKIDEAIRLNINTEHVVYLSDGTPIYGKTGLIG